MVAQTACSLLALLLGGVAGAQTPLSPPPTPYPAPPTVSAQLGAPQRMASETSALPTFAQQPPQPTIPQPRGGVRSSEQALDLNNQTTSIPIQLEPPGLERLAQSLQSDAQLKERIRQENRERATLERITFPVDPILSRDTYNGRKWDPMRLEVAPYYVCYGRIPLQQLNFERYGWDLGVLQPVICAGIFLFDVVTLPYQLAKEPCRHFEYNTGWCLPGDPVPLLLYPPTLSVSGFAAEVATVVTLVVVFP